ncbi:MAG: hypothetical protein LBK61_07170 [Spirochaetaceae bacterium]|jgi:hypothetical protein|nr:hypothetical protein [Spirochaetaceae bacterium]
MANNNWWNNYSPVPLEQIPATLRSTLSPNEVVVTISKNSWVEIFWLLFSPKNIVLNVCTVGIALVVRLFMLRRRMIVVTNQRILGSFNVRVFSTDKVDLPLRTIDSFGVDDTLFGNIFGYTKIKFMSRSATYFYPYITKESCQSIKNAYYDWDAKQSS